MEQARLDSQSGPAGNCRNTISMCAEWPDHIWSLNMNTFFKARCWGLNRPQHQSEKEPLQPERGPLQSERDLWHASSLAWIVMNSPKNQENWLYFTSPAFFVPDFLFCLYFGEKLFCSSLLHLTPQNLISYQWRTRCCERCTDVSRHCLSSSGHRSVAEHHHHHSITLFLQCNFLATLGIEFVIYIL